MTGRRSLGRTWGFDRGSESALLSTIAFLFITSIHIKQHAEFTDIGFAWYVVAGMVIKRGRGALLFWDARYDGDFIGCFFLRFSIGWVLHQAAHHYIMVLAGSPVLKSIFSFCQVADFPKVVISIF